MPRDNFLRMLQLADLMIDPLHFGGGNSSYEALAMGLPIVSLPGQFLRSRITQALYRKMQLCDFIATDADDFVQRAVRYARDEAVHGPTRTRIQDQAGCLFEDPKEVYCLEDTLQRVGRARKIE
jgi:predicted O-linked N-acetylglucosamine transferase (SPINDLY family)